MKTAKAHHDCVTGAVEDYCYFLSSYTPLLTQSKLAIALAINIFSPQECYPVILPTLIVKIFKYKCMTLHFIAILFHSSRPVQANLNFDFVVSPARVGPAFQKEFGFQLEGLHPYGAWELDVP